MLSTVEALFRRQSVFNFHNMHIWNNENSKAARNMSFQRTFSINVLGSCEWRSFLGTPHFSGKFKWSDVFDFLQHDLPEILDVIDPVKILFINKMVYLLILLMTCKIG